MADPSAPREVVKREKHGLRYEASQGGCVICRREAKGGPAPSAARPGAASASVAASTAASSTQPAPAGSIGAALGVTVLLLALATFGLYTAHAHVATLIQAFQGGGPDPMEAFTGMDETAGPEEPALPKGVAETLDDLSGKEPQAPPDAP